MKRRQVGPQAIPLQTSRFALVPIKPLRHARQTYGWTKQSDDFFSLGWRISGWTIRKWWRHLRQRTGTGKLSHAIIPRGTTRIIGLHSTFFSPGTKAATLSILIADKEWRGKGVVPEITATILEDCFGRLNLERVWTQVSAENAASIKNQLKSGFTHEGTMRSSAYARDGSRTDVLIFSLLRHEYEKSPSSTAARESRSAPLNGKAQ